MDDALSIHRYPGVSVIPVTDLFDKYLTVIAGCLEYGGQASRCPPYLLIPAILGMGPSFGRGSKVKGPKKGAGKGDGNHTPENNRAQNKQFNDATKGLTEAQKRRVHDEISGEGYDYHQIKDVADAIRNGQ
ncbi:hypothetical protein [Pseudomonas sp. 5P_3.1_Bac2]|uniref:hypothetical protein n=1 Tax=Pseudomonas sp. 5P_3.1_Bac2 TaxID=2971617 RepID=UPI0021C70859|nr:hypothetical protein [Pseudomonas sp. 5P_3.1_Bac2]MCU1716872.1 hypothetical protein [Pseudomonas sp. 5P_3.1_Bac2]